VRLLADEGVDAALVTRLRSDGHDVYVTKTLQLARLDSDYFDPDVEA